MKYLDFAVQSTTFLLAILFLATSYGDHDWLMVVLVAQLALGLWQYLSSLISVLVYPPFHKQKRTHLVISTLYILLLCIGKQEDLHGISFSREVGLLALTVPAWMLGIYYYIITCRWTFLKTKRQSSFLPHQSF
jgi:hypothetical protein